ncbi:DUF3997 domain-containing protein [Flavobacterium luteum]|nr:DUF3997 domain-containing protein [Flavobacterium luteum]
MKNLPSIILIISIVLTSCEDSMPVINKEYKLQYDRNSDIYLIKIKNEETLIQGHIMFYGYNKNFIIAQQKFQQNITEANLANNYNDRRKAVFESNLSAYYIFKIDTDSVFGPFDKQEYLSVRERLNIPSILKFNHSTLSHYTNGQRKDVGYKIMDEDVIDIKNLKGNESVNSIFNE